MEKRFTGEKKYAIIKRTYFTKMQIHFHGAAGGVTGSKHIIEVSGKKILLDCGMYQGQRKQSMELNKTLPFSPQEIDAVLLSHAHIDHSGLLPLLAKMATGDIWCTPATADILTPMLLDAAHIQEADAQYFLRKNIFERLLFFPLNRSIPQKMPKLF